MNKEIKFEEDNQPLMVTIQCITYNHESFIRECLEGFVMQKTNFRFEAVVHDDASTDGTANIIREYAQKYPNIIKPIFEVENQYSKNDGSLGKIMNEHTHGKYVAICEGDDCWIDPYKLQKQVDLLERYPDCSMCCGGYIRREKGKADIIRSISTKKGFFFFNLKDWSKHWLSNPLTIMYRKNCLEEFNRKAASYKYNRDIHLIYHLLKCGRGIYFSDVVAIYHLHPGGICSPLSLAAKAVQSYNCYKELYINNGDEVLRNSFLSSINRMLLFKTKNRYIFKEGWDLTNTILEKLKLCTVFMCPHFISPFIRKLLHR